MIDRFVVTLLLMLLSERAIAWDDTHAIEGTFSIIARDTAAGELGMAVQSKAHAVGSRTISAKGGLGVIAHQAQSNPMYGQVGLDLLARGMAPQQALDFMLRGDEGRENRQVAILDMQGRSAAWTGKNPRDFGKATVVRRTTASKATYWRARKSSTAWWPPLKPRRVSHSQSVSSPHSTADRPRAVTAAACRQPRW